MRNSTRKKRFDSTELQRDLDAHKARLRNLRIQRRTLRSTLFHLEADVGHPAVRSQIAAIKKDINSIGDSIARTTIAKNYIDRLLAKQEQETGGELLAH